MARSTTITTVLTTARRRVRSKPAAIRSSDRPEARRSKSHVASTVQASQTGMQEKIQGVARHGPGTEDLQSSRAQTDAEKKRERNVRMIFENANRECGIGKKNGSAGEQCREGSGKPILLPANPCQD